MNPNDFRINGEKTALFFGLGILAFILIFITALSVGVLTAFVVATTAIVVWVQQSQLIGSAVKISRTQFPRIDAISQNVADNLGMEKVDIFIMQSPILNAFAIGFLGKKSVVVHSATVEAMSDKELEFIIGHEFSHIKCGHTNVSVLTSSSRGIGVPIISHLLSFVFLFWNRKAEYTCDRGGLLANRNREAAISAMCKLAVGPTLFGKMDAAAFLNQRVSLDDNDFSHLSEKLATHPYLVKRIHAISEYFESKEYKSLSNTSDTSISSSSISSLHQRTIKPVNSFHFTARNSRGEKIVNTIEAKDKREALIGLEKLGYLPIRIEPVTNVNLFASGEQIRPWVRLWARLLDLYAFALLFNILLAFTYPAIINLPAFVYGALILFSYILFEASMLAGCGTTLGKGLFRIRVRNSDGSRLNFIKSLCRSFDVWVRGQGCCIPFVALFTYAGAYSKLTKEGITSWDKEGEYSVSHQTIGILRITIAVFLLSVVAVLFGLAD